ncbi:ABC transporter substrate-binding protein [Janibacter corallicola]|uniref:ABC transporter substrate-binding protein n=1 Tax=Janibacter corallicola TaxID=415212 RepID=UPI0009FC808E|nr:ABC transporter substrate-binding protein [Janibacter corallicola]
MSIIRRRRSSFVAVGAAVALLGASACSSNAPAVGEDGEPIVRFSGLPDPAPLPVIVMQEEGLDEKYGFEADFVEIDPDVSTTSFLMGESDIAVDQDAVSSSIANNQGHDVVSFYPALANTASIVAAPGSGITGPEDLVGKRVGHFGMDSGTTQALSVSLKRAHDIDVSDFELVQSAPASLPQLLASGEVDAIFDYEPYSANAIKLTGGEYVFQVTPYWEKATGWSPALAMLTARRDWLADNPDLSRDVLKAWKEAEALVADSDYTMFLEEPYASFLDRDSKEELRTLADYCDRLECYTASWDTSDVKKQNAYLDRMVDQGMLEAVPKNEPTATLEQVVGP